MEIGILSLLSSRVDRFLSDDIDLTFHDEHPLPWHPPICERLSDTVAGIDDIPGIKERHTLTTRNPDPHAVPYLMKYGKVEAEIGQRISSAMKKVRSWRVCVSSFGLFYVLPTVVCTFVCVFVNGRLPQF